MKKNSFIMLIALLLFAPANQASAVQPEDLTIDVWLDRGDGGVYNRGEQVTVYFKTSTDCFVTLYNIDTDGYIRILFPSYTGEGNYVQGGKTYAVPAGHHEDFFVIDEPTGIGYIEAAASLKPFFLEGWPFYTQRGEEGHYGDVVIERISGDPFLAIEEINQKILPFGEDASYSDDFSVYYVEEIVDHPRYVCNDCHIPTYYHYDPYYYHCSHVDIVVFDYWWYNRWFYCDYWWADYYYYYDYYYYAPPPSYLARRYTRKYGYTVKGSGGYTTKGYGDRGGTVRVNDYYRDKDNYRGDFKPVGTKNNPVLSYKLPKTTNEPGYGGGVQKRGPAGETGSGAPEVNKLAPKGQPGSDFRDKRETQSRGPVTDGRGTVSEGIKSYDGKVTEGRKTYDGRGSVEQRSPSDDRSTPSYDPSKANRAGRADEGSSRSGNSGSVTQKAPSRESAPSRPESRKEYELRGWDKEKSGDSKTSSGISIIKSKPRRSSDDRKVSPSRSQPSRRESVSPSRSQPSTRKAVTPSRSKPSGGRAISSGRSQPSSRSVSKPGSSSGSSRGAGPSIRRK